MGEKNKEIVKYDNKLNQIDFSGFSSLELNLFYCALCKLKEKSTTAVTITYDEICLIANLKKRNPQYVFDKLKEVKKKVFHLTLDPLGISRPDVIDYEQHIFMDWKNDKTEESLTFSIHPDFAWLINHNKLGFTSFELLEFVNMKSLYAKNLFRVLKQWKKKGIWKAKLPELRKGLCIPSGTRDEYVSSRILKPAVKEILEKTGSFRELRFKGDYDGRNHKLVGFTFCWEAENRPKAVCNKQETDESVAYQLKDQVITKEEYRLLVSEFDKNIVDKTISRIIEKPYIGCLSITTIREWCSDVKPAPAVNKFHNFEQREYDFEELEKKLYRV